MRTILVLLITLLMRATAAHAFVCLQTNNVCLHWTHPATLQSVLGVPLRIPLSNGTITWDQNSITAVNKWNVLGTSFQLSVTVGGSFNQPCGPQGAGHVCPNTGNVNENPILFASSFCGRAFGDILELVNNCFDPNSGAMLNSPVFVNNGVVWDAYDGDIRFNNGVAVNDIERVLLHEFGHVFGLAHPDDHGQQVQAIMNSHESNLFQLQSDDIEGAFSIYPNGAPASGGAPPTMGCQLGDARTGRAGWMVPAMLLAVLLRASALRRKR